MDDLGKRKGEGEGEGEKTERLWVGARNTRLKRRRRSEDLSKRSRSLKNQEIVGDKKITRKCPRIVEDEKLEEDVVSFLSDGDKRNYLVRNNGDRVGVDTVAGKYLVICCFKAPLPNDHMSGFNCRAMIAAYSRLVSENANLEMVMVAKMVGSTMVAGNDEEAAFNRFFTAFPCLAIPFSDESMESIRQSCVAESLEFEIVLVQVPFLSDTSSYAEALQLALEDDKLPSCWVPELDEEATRRLWRLSGKHASDVIIFMGDGEELFKEFREIVDVRLATYADGRNKGHGIVDFATAEAVQKLYS
ncbi:hypothetical protein OROHE_020508 [Orobanche hederae]